MTKIAVVGSGNLAWHLVPALQRIGRDVILVSRAPELTPHWPCPVIPYSTLATEDPQIVILAVPDGKIGETSKYLATLLPPSVLVLHTSGATAMKKIDGYFAGRGVIWPIRSLRKNEPTPAWRDLPLAYQGNNLRATTTIRQIAQGLSGITYELDSQQRAMLHLAAVFSNNFVTWMYQISYELTAEKDIPFATLLPIIRNTAAKIDGTEPRLIQTGAAARGDRATLDRHLKQLKGHPEFARLYRLMSHLIEEGLDDLRES